ncbi:hypothetical protein BCR33DRAFT_720599 [Rhizoclosmatium globosum]|uniref:G-protein coupled receptors family 2 profile 2 domain-containing protein n=1 Tax=Rhizoclosmatium globosum TaxID=329046 RepID=A0A1Y2BUY4_9FUNG|nr:hypothetical protein BCR33DRAFT_720599 [Rhizoclosmatium globosum]|eukprot:ORY38553.1 hypothetical protein BCR33DRAFT_720599 [Rhizoclosmatium globosum]
MWCYHSLVWGSAALFTAALFVLQAVLQRGPVMGDAQLECWISDEYKEFRIYFFYLILWVEYAAIVGMYVLVFMKVKSMTDEAHVDTSVTIALTKGRKRIIAKALSLAIGVALYLAQAMTMSAHGLSDALIFLVFAFIVKFSSTTGSVSMVSLGEQSRRRITSGNSDNQSFC